jgi:hypothetical protein
METMAAEQVLDVVMRRHVIDSDRPFDQVLAGIFGGISQPDIAQLFGELEASGTYQQFSSLVEQAQGSAGLMRFWQLDLDNALTLDPEAPDWTGQGLDKRELRQAGDVVDLDCPPFFIDRVEDAVPSGPKAPQIWRPVRERLGRPRLIGEPANSIPERSDTDGTRGGNPPPGPEPESPS